MTHPQCFNKPHFNFKIRSKWNKREAGKAKAEKHLKEFTFQFIGTVGISSSLCRPNFLFSFILNCFRLFSMLSKAENIRNNTIPLWSEIWLVYCVLNDDSLQSIKVFERMKMKDVLETNMKIVHPYQISNEIFHHVKMDFYHFFVTCEVTCVPFSASGYLFKENKTRFHVQRMSDR